MRRHRRLCLVLLFFFILWCCGALLLFSRLIADYGPSPNADAKLGRDGVTSKQRSIAPRLAVLVPFRDRFYELSVFLPHMRRFLEAQRIEHHVFVLHQVDEFRFNRASLVNVGYRETRDRFNYVAIHDVDLLPLNPNVSYEYPARGPVHLTPPALHPRYHYKTFLGGVLLMTHDQFLAAGGMSNLFWGWGREDDEFRLRLLESGMQILRPVNITTGYRTFRHIHNAQQHPRDMRLYHNQRKLTFRRDIDTGVETVRYRVSRRYPLAVDNAIATVLDVALECDLDWTPYCRFPS